MKTVQAIIEKHGGMEQLKRTCIKIENEPYMPLCIEYVGIGPRGLPMVSVAHYGEQNGDAMRDPDVVFEVGYCYPYGYKDDYNPVSYRNDYLGLDQEAVWTANDRNGVLIKPRLVKQIKSFSVSWSKTLKEQGFLRAPVTSSAY